jgi:hypothetical protein
MLNTFGGRFASVIGRSTVKNISRLKSTKPELFSGGWTREMEIRFNLDSELGLGYASGLHNAKLNPKFMKSYQETFENVESQLKSLSRDNWKYQFLKKIESPSDIEALYQTGTKEERGFYRNMLTEWPPNNGAIEDTEEKVSLEEGIIIDRFGDDKGTYFGEDGIAFDKRAMHPDSYEDVYSRFVVVKSFDVGKGQVAEWFNESGNGFQLKADISVEKLLEGGYLRRVDE